MLRDRVEYTYGTPMSVLPSFAERKRVWVFRRCTLSQGPHVMYEKFCVAVHTGLKFKNTTQVTML